MNDFSDCQNKCVILIQTYDIEDCSYYKTTEYSSETSLNITLPASFKVEFDIKPTSRSGSSGGNSAYIRIGSDSSTGLWAGQMTSGGTHGIIPRPSGDWIACPTITQLDWNHVTVTYNGTTVCYNCNSETVTYNISSLTTKINGVYPTSNEHLKNIKVKPL